MPRRLIALAVLLVPLVFAGCSAERTVRYGDTRPSKADAYDATFKAFEDCGLNPKGNKADLRVKSAWDWGGIGGGSQTLLFPLMWAQYEAVVHDEGVDLEGNAYGWGIWLGLFENLPVKFPIGTVEDKIRARLRELPAGKSGGG